MTVNAHHYWQMPRRVGVAVAVMHRIGAAIGGPYGVPTRCIRGLYDLQSAYEVMRQVFGR